jgi:hypothetical protein
MIINIIEVFINYNVMKKINQKLCVGDKIKLWHMEGETGMPPGLEGIVTRLTNFSDNTIQYEIKWKNDRTLDLLSDTDAWILIERGDNNCEEEVKESSINESDLSKFKAQREFINKHKEVLKSFDTEMLTSFLEALRQCSWVNMFQSSVYLYSGKENIKKMHPFNEESEMCSTMLDLADEAKNEMISGTIKYMENSGKEISIENVNSQIKRLSLTILKWFMHKH